MPVAPTPDGGSALKVAFQGERYACIQEAFIYTLQKLTHQNLFDFLWLHGTQNPPEALQAHL